MRGLLLIVCAAALAAGLGAPASGEAIHAARHCRSFTDHSNGTGQHMHDVRVRLVSCHTAHVVVHGLYSGHARQIGRLPMDLYRVYRWRCSYMSGIVDCTRSGGRKVFARAG